MAPVLGPQPFYLHVGVAGIFNDPRAHISVASAPIPGAAVKIADRATFAVEAGYFIAANIAVSVSGGVPPISKVEAAGTLSGLGAIGKTQGGPIAATVHYHFGELGAFQPYIGAGVSALVVFSDEDRLLRRYRTEEAVGVVLQAGFDLMLDAHWGVFFDAKKGFIATNTRGYLTGLPAHSSVSLDPVVLHSGLTYRF
ncbi:OmpW/AlkL family protein [Methylobacterium tardum]|nr:OmpW family outer membrane protein [Methylobacterium tardum]